MHELIVNGINVMQFKELAQKKLDFCKIKAHDSERKRFALNLVDGYQKETQVMLNYFLEGTYVRPHYHINKNEYFVVIKGRLGVVVFENNGLIQKKVIINEGEYFQIKPKEIHCCYAASSGTAVLEILDKPYDPQTHKYYPEWSIPENSPDCSLFLKKIIN